MTFPLKFPTFESSIKMKPIKSNAILTALLILSVPLAPSTFAHSTDVHDYYPKPKAYPLEKCLVTDKKFGEGHPYVFTHNRQEIKLCRKSCRNQFKKDPAKYLQKLSGPK